MHRTDRGSRFRRPRLLLAAAVVALTALVAGAGTAFAAGGPPAAHHHPAPAVSEAIRAAYAQALTGGQDPAHALAAVQDGPNLAGALAEATANFPTAVKTAEVMTGTITLTGPSSATVRFHVTYQEGADFGPQTGTAVKIHGHWKVSRGTYCTVLGWAFATCP